MKHVESLKRFTSSNRFFSFSPPLLEFLTTELAGISSPSRRDLKALAWSKKLSVFSRTTHHGLHSSRLLTF